jgi:hypothetical protein
MNREDIIRMAREAEVPVRGHYDEQGLTPQELERFAALVAAAEREICAKICEAQRNAIVKRHPARIEFDPNDLVPLKCAAAIRARGEK